MRPELIVDVISASIPIFGGILALFVAIMSHARTLAARESPGQRRRRIGPAFFVVGPILILVGVVSLALAFVRDAKESSISNSAPWIRYKTSDGICSAEFPEEPKHNKSVAFGIESDNMKLLLNGGATYYILSYSEVPSDAPPATNDERLDALRDGLPAMAEASRQKFKFVREQKISVNEVAGREIEFEAGTKFTFRAKIFLQGVKIYRIIAVTPRSDSDDASTRHFLDSIQFAKMAE